MSERFTWPIYPKQLTTECAAGCTNRNLDKCLFCGIGTTGFVRDSVLDTFSKDTRFPVTLIERIACAKKKNELLNSELIQKWNRIESKNTGNLYYRNGNDFYNVYDFSENFEKIPNVGCKSCFKYRKENSEGKTNCVVSDLEAAAYVFQHREGSESGDVPHEEGEWIVRRTGGLIDQEYYRYTCKKSGEDLIELAFPIQIDGTCVAVMIIGQIQKDLYDVNIADICERVKNFCVRMQERTNIRRSDYLYHFLNQCTKIIQEQRRLGNEEFANAADILNAVYYKIANQFNYEVLDILSANNGTDISLRTYKKEIYRENLERLTKDGQSKKAFIECIASEDEFEIKTLLGLSSEDFVYIQHSSIVNFDCFILTITRHCERKPDPITMENEATFFNTVNAYLFSLLMTETAQSKQEELQQLMKVFSHDINQKIAITENHTIRLENKSRVWAGGDERMMDDIRDYVKDMRNLTRQLRYFVCEVTDKYNGSLVKRDEKTFRPYTAFLFNLEEYYSTTFTERRFCMPRVFEVSRNPSRYPDMKAEPVMIERCVNNLLSNAYKYSYRFTNVYLDCYLEKKNEEEKKYVIEVTNYGAGIPDSILNTIFEKGVTQGKNYRNPKGSGYGLVLVKEIVETHHRGKACNPVSTAVSAFNVPLLRRIVQEYGRQGGGERNRSFLKRIGLSEDDYAVLETEYRRLQDTPSDESNYVLDKEGVDSLLDEVSFPKDVYNTSLTRSYIQESLNTPTFRIRFRVEIPQKG